MLTEKKINLKKKKKKKNKTHKKYKTSLELKGIDGHFR